MGCFGVGASAWRLMPASAIASGQWLEKRWVAVTLAWAMVRGSVLMGPPALRFEGCCFVCLYRDLLHRLFKALGAFVDGRGW